MGVTYFKLKSGYNGDYTKNCGLTGEEIDGNFNFLRGYDIDGIEIDNATGVITLKRVNGEEMHVKAGETIGEFKIDFNPVTGTLTYTTFNGQVYKVEGFLSEYSSIKMSTDSTVDGNGTIHNPLRISAFAKTGQYAPAHTMIDCAKGELLPKGETVGKGYRVVTREKIDKLGRLYDLNGVREIMKDLEMSEWRVPSKEDWDTMLNSIELCDEDRNHDSRMSNAFLGKNAGAFLKSLNIWDSYPTKNDEESFSGEDKFNFQVLPLGYGTNRPTMVEGEDCDAEGMRKITAFWTSTPANDIDDMFVKEFSYRSRKVRQYTKEPDAYLSLRLVKDYVGDNYESIETINGQTVPCVLMMNSLQIWTQINVGFTQEQYHGATSLEWSDLTDADRGLEVRYFVNEWEGDKWVKGEMTEGDTIVLYDYSDRKYHEWKLIDGVLVDVLDAFKGDLQEELTNLNVAIDELKEADSILQDLITNNENEIDLLKENTEKLSGRADVLEEEVVNLQGQIKQNKVVADATNSLVVTPNSDGNGTSIKVNIPTTHSNIKADENGLYFDGFMGNF